MSCDCSSESAYDGGIYGGVCNTDTPYPSVSHESVPSLIDNLVYALYGAITKDVTSGKVVWNIPCDPSNIPATINGIPRNDGEGLLCYIVRALNLTTPSGFVTINGVQTLLNKTLDASCSLLGNAATSTTAINIAGGLAGSIPYQTGAGLTTLLPQGTAGQVLSTNGSGTLGWITNSTTSSATNNVNGGTAGVVVYQTGVNTTGFTAAGTSGQVLLSNGTSAPTWSTNIAGQAGSVANGSVTPAKLSTGGPSWDTSGNTTLGGGLTITGAVTGATNITASNTIQGAQGIITTAATSGTPFQINNTSSGAHNWAIISTGSGNTGGAGSLLFFDSTVSATRMYITALGNVNMQGGQINDCKTTAKAWVNFNGSTLAIASSYNVSSITRLAVGNFTVNFSTALNNANYSAVTGTNSSQGSSSVKTGSNAVGGFNITTQYFNGSTTLSENCTITSSIVFGN